MLSFTLPLKVMLLGCAKREDEHKKNSSVSRSCCVFPNTVRRIKLCMSFFTSSFMHGVCCPSIDFCMQEVTLRHVGRYSQSRHNLLLNGSRVFVFSVVSLRRKSTEPPSMLRTKYWLLFTIREYTSTIFAENRTL